VEKIFAEVAEKEGVHKNLVKAIFRHVFMSTAEVMKKGEFQNILLTGFGKFVVNPRRKHTLDIRYRRNGTKPDNTSN